MGKESPSYAQERVRPAARRLKTKTLSSPSLLSNSSTPPPTAPTAPTTMAVSSAQTPPLTFRQHTTLTRPELPSGRVVEYPCTPRTAVISTARTPRDSDTQTRSKPWAVTGPSTNVSNRKKRLENVNLRGSRKTSKTSTYQGTTTSSCIRSESTTNDSQKSALTSESIEAVPVPPEERGDENEGMKEQEELTEEEIERRKNIEKCMNWIVKLPAKFSGMHIVQERAPVTHD